MSILDDDSFESYFAVDTSTGGSRCTDVKGRYDSCFFKSYSEKYQQGSGHMEKCESLFSEYKACLNKTLKTPSSPPPHTSVTRIPESDPWKRMTSSK